MSINAELVAKDVISLVSSGKKVNMQEVQKKHGYSASSARAMKAVRTNSYKAIMIPALQRMENIRNKVLKALENKDMTLEDSRVLKELLDSTTKNIQLLSGKATENVQTSITVVNYADQTPLEVPSTQAGASLGTSTVVQQLDEPVEDGVTDTID